ncbi:MAG TPA: IMP dehydrogenase, partial [Chitinophagaceae bacterium]|nr:IMP dehydrogenase [Chitinophagaceae bacterium]
MATRNISSLTASDIKRFFGEGLTFDDVLLMPGYSQVLPRDTDIRTRLTKSIMLNIP